MKILPGEKVSEGTSSPGGPENEPIRRRDNAGELPASSSDTIPFWNFRICKYKHLLYYLVTTTECHTHEIDSKTKNRATKQTVDLCYDRQ